MTGCVHSIKSLLVQHVPNHRGCNLLSSAQYNKNGSINNAVVNFDCDYSLALAYLPVKYSGVALPNTVNSATPKHRVSKDVCKHLIGAVKKMRQLLGQLSISKPWQQQKRNPNIPRLPA